MGGHNSGEEGRVELVHGGIRGLAGGRFEGPGQEGELEFGLTGEGLEDFKRAEDVERGEAAGEEEAPVSGAV